MTPTDETTLLPELLGEHPNGDSLTLDLRIPENLAYFPGHFAGTPIVPGVVQIQWAVHFARERLKLQGAFGHMEVIKFKDLMLPGQRLSLRLTYLAENGKLSFSYRADDREFSSGRLYFRGNDV